jgi:hypothetical protein
MFREERSVTDTASAPVNPPTSDNSGSWQSLPPPERRATWWQWIRSFFGSGEPDTDQASVHMLQLQITNLEVRFLTIDPQSLTTESDKKICEAVAEGLRKAKEVSTGGWSKQVFTWDDAYKIERMIGLLLRGEHLKQEIAAQLAQAAADKVPGAETLQASYTALSKLIEDAQKASPPPTPPLNADAILRGFLLRITEAVQWVGKKQYLARVVRGQATRKLLICGLVALALLVAPYVFLTFKVMLQETSQRADLPTYWTLAAVAASTPTAVFSGGKIWSLFSLYTALTAGLLGAVFSRLIKLQSQWAVMTLDELFIARDYKYILLRASVGVCGALVVYFVLQSGLMEGKVFPDFKNLSIDLIVGGPAKDGVFAAPMRLLLPSKDLALLITWSFIAGFSEVLVPNMLASTENQLSGAIGPKK